MLCKQFGKCAFISVVAGKCFYAPAEARGLPERSRPQELQDRYHRAAAETHTLEDVRRPGGGGAMLTLRAVDFCQ